MRNLLHFPADGFHEFRMDVAVQIGELQYPEPFKGCGKFRQENLILDDPDVEEVSNTPIGHAGEFYAETGKMFD